MQRLGARFGAAGAWLRRVFWTRRAASLVLVVVTCVLLLASAFSIYVRQVALDTPTWVTASGKLLANDTIRPVVATYLVDELFSTTDVPARLQSALPSPIDRLVTPAADLIRQQAIRAANLMLESPRVQALWERANEVAHSQFVAAVEGNSETRSESGDVVLGLGPLVEDLGERIGLPRVATAVLSNRAGQIVIVPAETFERAERAANALRIASIWLAIGAFFTAVAGVWLARGRRRETVRALATGFLMVALTLFVVRRFIGTAVVDELTDAESVRPAALVAWYIATEALSETAWVILALGVVGVLWSWLSGPMRWAQTARRWLAPKIGASVAAFYAVAAVIALVLLAWGPLSGIHTFIGLVIVIVILALGVESFRRQVLREYPMQRKVGDQPPVVGHGRSAQD